MLRDSPWVGTAIPPSPPPSPAPSNPAQATGPAPGGWPLGMAGGRPGDGLPLCGLCSHDLIEGDLPSPRAVLLGHSVSLGDSCDKAPQPSQLKQQRCTYSLLALKAGSPRSSGQQDWLLPRAVGLTVPVSHPAPGDLGCPGRPSLPGLSQVSLCSVGRRSSAVPGLDSSA